VFYLKHINSKRSVNLTDDGVSFIGRWVSVVGQGVPLGVRAVRLIVRGPTVKLLVFNNSGGDSTP